MLSKTTGKRLLLLKNPWSHLRWKGNYSEMDQRHWTPALRQALSYDPQSAQQFDNGVFWIDYESLVRFFDVFYMSWNPQVFSHTFAHHQTWLAGLGPIRDMYNIGENPQYRLEVRGPTVVWVLLSRHITEIEDFRNNKEYITVAVYRTDGRRVFYPNEPEPYMEGGRINSPHYLCKLTLKRPALHLHLVIAHYEKLNTIHYTLGVPYLPTQHSVTGEWRGVTAGGCTNHPHTYPNNPVYQLRLPAAASLTLQLKGPRVYQMGVDITCVEANPESPGYFRRQSSGSYRSGFVVLALENVPRGTYNIVPSTYMPGQEGPFILSLLAAEPAQLARIK
ncbi:LOW QUALITY PROTEIN: calpain-7-like [Pollicipes pollicipes]|uniref:LOW QUALITY PROTEIN: calpain-7-like n=1 Tax=Pollicipes pollicipes TaxID=41117 RepID=UPI0018855B31|nr:LOW QUALITY PROTEIN: calpain-7-like [Pollicipes pollicipes]